MSTVDSKIENNSAVLIFGGAGFIASHLICNLKEAGCKNIISVDIKKPKMKISDVTYLNHDIRNLDDLEDFKFVTKIYNLAAIHTTPGYQAHEYYETNILGALEICEYAERCDIREIVFTSSISVYGPSEKRKTEKSSLTPSSAYGYSKMIAEKVHRNWLDHNADRRLIIVRPAVVFGTREGGNFTRLTSLLKKGFFIYPGRKDTIKACIYVEDLLAAIEFSDEQNEPLVIFNAAYHYAYTLENIIDTFRKKHFQHVRTFFVPYIVLSLISRVLKIFNLFNIGIHPDRIKKLVQSTDVYPAWLVSKGKVFDNGLEKALDHWAKVSAGEFK